MIIEIGRFMRPSRFYKRANFPRKPEPEWASFLKRGVKWPLTDSAGALAHAYGLSPGIQGRVCRSVMSSTVCASATLRKFAVTVGPHDRCRDPTSPNDSLGADGASAEPGVGE